MTMALLPSLVAVRGEGEQSPERGSGPRFVVKVNRPAVPMNDAEADGQSQAIRLSALGGKERLKDAGADLLRDPLSLVLHQELHLVALLRTTGRQNDRTTLRHRLLSIHDQVDQDLLDLGRAAPSCRETLLDAALEGDVSEGGLSGNGVPCLLDQIAGVDADV